MNRCGRSRPGNVDGASACQVGTRPGQHIADHTPTERFASGRDFPHGADDDMLDASPPIRPNDDVATLNSTDDVNDQDVDNGLWSKVYAFGRRELRLNNGEREAGNDIALLEVGTFTSFVPRWSVPLSSFHAASYSSPSLSSAASSWKTVGAPWRTVIIEPEPEMTQAAERMGPCSSARSISANGSSTDSSRCAVSGSVAPGRVETIRCGPPRSSDIRLIVAGWPTV